MMEGGHTFSIMSIVQMDAKRGSPPLDYAFGKKNPKGNIVEKMEGKGGDGGGGGGSGGRERGDENE